MEIEILLKEYQSVLLQYNQVNADYLNYIKNVDQSNVDKDFTNIENSEYTGTTISQTASSNVGTCSASCSTTTGCTGATFNNTVLSGKNNCSLVSGAGTVNNKINSTAIITKKSYYLNKLKILNNQLIAINQQIQTYIETNKSDMISNLSKNQSISDNLYNKLNFFSGEKTSMEDQIESINDLDNVVQESDYLVNQKYILFRFLAIIAVLAFCIFIYMAFTGNSSSESVNSSASGFNTQTSTTSNI